MRTNTMQNDTEYKVYIYKHPSEHNPHDWEHKATTSTMRNAVKRAKVLHRSQKYRRVEIKKRHISAQTQKRADKIVKIYGPDCNRIYFYHALALGLIALSAGVFFFLYAL